MKYRSRTEIAAKMLHAANGGASKTRLMYSAYLSYAQLKEYLSFLLDKGLLALEDGKETYTLTQKGLRFLRAYGEISKMVTLADEGERRGVEGMVATV